MIRLGAVAAGRDNNFNLIRFAAATAVLVSHAWPIALGPDAVQPLQQLTGHTLGTLAVFVFFAVSGFFISASFARSAGVTDFLWARVLRLFPCLAVALVLAAFVMGPAVTRLPLSDYLTHPATWTSLPRNLTLAFPQYTLPGVFETNPYPTVQGSIWTLIHEVLCYGLVFLAGITGLLQRRAAMTAALVAYVLLWALPALVGIDLHPRIGQLRELSFPFVLGMAFWLWRDRLPLSVWGVAGLVLLAAVTKDTPLGFSVLMLAITYVTFWFAYVPDGAIRGWNRLGDYSYGLYIYAFPLQGLMVWAAGPMGPGMNMALSLPLTLAFAVISWHLIEAPALAMRHRGR
jgi:peptidoglycan/LPS O-acetylase OafA/YrhL